MNNDLEDLLAEMTRRLLDYETRLLELESHAQPVKNVPASVPATAPELADVIQALVDLGLVIEA